MADPGPLLNTLRDSRRRVWLPVRGISMRPLLREGDEIQVEFVPEAEAGLGDVGLLEREGVLIAHRLIHRDLRGAWLEKGDSSPGASWVRPGEWVGRVTHVRRRGRERSLDRRGLLARVLLWWSRLRLRLRGRFPSGPP